MSGAIEPLGQWLRSTIDGIASQPDAQRLVRALLLADGFKFHLLVAKSVLTGAALLLWLQDMVGGEDEERPLRMVRLSPYPLDPREPGPGPLSTAMLESSVLDRLHDAQALENDRFVVIDAVRASRADVEAWKWLFARINEQRNTVGQDIRCTLLLLVSPQLEAELAWRAPDLWSIRGLFVTIETPPQRGQSGAELIATTLIRAHDEEVVDPDEIEALQAKVAGLRQDCARIDRPVIWRSLLLHLIRLAQGLRRIGQIEGATKVLDEALAIADRLQDEGARGACLLALSDVQALRGDLDLALRSLREEVLPIMQRSGDEWALANVQGRIADILEARGQLDEALRIRNEEELPVYDKLGDVRSRAVTMGKIAGILRARGQLDEALRIRIEEELPVYGKLGDVRSRAVTMGKIADIHQTRGQLDEALRIRKEEQLPVYDKLGDVRSRAVTMGKIADIHQARGELDEALSILEDELVPVFEQLGDVRSLAATMGRIAGILKARGELDEALRIRNEEQLPVYDKLGDVRSLLVTQVEIAITLARRGRPKDAPEIAALLRTAYEAARSHGYDPDVAKIQRIYQQIVGRPIGS
ncbi:MAG TPA: hypothetical protein ENJ18_09270 [Nannocystis exedens]|nr:hypothetical protein [Nannocystis exedens]